MSFVQASDYSRSVRIDLDRLRPVFQHLEPDIREQVARAIHQAYPDLLVTAMPNGMFSFEKL